MRFPKKPPKYILPHGIEVIGEYQPTTKNPYWRVRIRPHRFFEVKSISGGIYVKRSRVVMSSILGRRLLPSELVHHCSEDKTDDSAGNLEIISPAEHNRHHKVGTSHSTETKIKIGNGLRAAIAEGRRLPPPHVDWTGRKHSPEAIRKMQLAAKNRSTKKEKS